MTDTKNYSKMQVISSKDISLITGLSLRTSQQIYSDIKRDNSLQRVTYSHLQTYLKCE